MTDYATAPESAAPLKAVDFHILLVLTDGPCHGYGIVKEIETRSDGGLKLQPGNLYRYVRRLVDDGFVVPAGREPTLSEEAGAAGAEETRRRYYEITASGRQALAAETARMRALVQAAESRLRASG